MGKERVKSAMDIEASDSSVVRLEDGRALCYARYGAPGGKPIYFFHGFPGSRLQAALLTQKAAALGVELIAPDRPGFGRSTHEPRRTLLTWPRDVAQLANHLRHERFDVIGVSCGGPYALACAHELPQRIGVVGLLAGMGPMSLRSLRAQQMPALRVMFRLARINPWLISPLLLSERLLYRGSTQRAVRTMARMLTAPDAALLRNDEALATAFIRSLAEAYSPGIGGAIYEAKLIASDRPFDLRRIETPVHVFQGHADLHVPPAMGRHLAEALPAGHLYERPNEGHLSIVWNCFEECVRAMKPLS